MSLDYHKSWQRSYRRWTSQWAFHDGTYVRLQHNISSRRNSHSPMCFSSQVQSLTWAENHRVRFCLKASRLRDLSAAWDGYIIVRRWGQCKAFMISVFLGTLYSWRQTARLFRGCTRSTELCCDLSGKSRLQMPRNHCPWTGYVSNTRVVSQAAKLAGWKWRIYKYDTCGRTCDWVEQHMLKAYA